MARDEFADGAPKKMRLETADWQWSHHKYGARTGTPGHYHYKYSETPQEGAHQPYADQKPQNKSNVLKPEGQSVYPTYEQKKSSEEREGHATPARGQSKKPPMGKPQQHPNAPQPVPQQQGDVTPPTGMAPGQHNQQTEAAPKNTFNPLQHFQEATQKHFERAIGTQNMAGQARAAGNEFNSIPEAIGGYSANQDNPQLNLLHPDNMKTMPGITERYGKCHEMSQKYATALGGYVYTTGERDHSIAITPDQKVYDFVLGIEGMPVHEYESKVPRQFFRAS